MLIAPDLLGELIAHAREEYDAECCGVIAYPAAVVNERALAATGVGAAGGERERAEPELPRAMQVRRARNVYASRKRFEIDGLELLRAKTAFEERGWDIGAIYHSHTHTAPYPSQTDINFAANWPGLEWVIVGLAGEQPEVRCYLIDDGVVRELELEVR